MAYESPRRIVVWAAGSEETAHAASWAAAHAAVRRLPLHVVQVAAAGTLADAVPVGGAATTFAARNQTAVELVRLAHEMHHIRDLHPHLPVTVEVVENGTGSAHRPPIEAGDLLVTGTAGFLRLPGRYQDHDIAGRGPDPVVVVPDRPPGEPADGARRRLLLLTGPRLAPTAAAFAFRAAADLGATLDVVRVLPQDEAFGDDYWIDTGRSVYRAESRLQNELLKMRALFPNVPGIVAILRTRPWTTLRSMARNTHLAVLGGGADAGRDLGALLEFGLCPVAVVPGT